MLKSPVRLLLWCCGEYFWLDAAYMQNANCGKIRCSMISFAAKAAFYRDIASVTLADFRQIFTDTLVIVPDISGKRASVLFNYIT